MLGFINDFLEGEKVKIQNRGGAIKDGFYAVFPGNNADADPYSHRHDGTEDTYLWGYQREYQGANHTYRIKAGTCDKLPNSAGDELQDCGAQKILVVRSKNSTPGQFVPYLNATIFPGFAGASYMLVDPKRPNSIKHVTYLKKKDFWMLAEKDEYEYETELCIERNRIIKARLQGKHNGNGNKPKPQAQHNRQNGNGNGNKPKPKPPAQPQQPKQPQQTNNICQTCNIKTATPFCGHCGHKF